MEKSSSKKDSVLGSKNKLNALEIASKWHLKIAKELEFPILPEEMDEKLKTERLKEISRQRQKHILYSKVIGSLIKVRKSQKES
jgi:hypothetical protein